MLNIAPVLLGASDHCASQYLQNMVKSEAFPLLSIVAQMPKAAYLFVWYIYAIRESQMLVAIICWFTLALPRLGYDAFLPYTE